MKRNGETSRREFILKAGLTATGLGFITSGLKASLFKNFFEPNSEITTSMVKIKTGLINQNDVESLGLSVIPANHKIIHDVSNQPFKYSHIPQLTVFQNKLYLMWNSGLEHEDWNGQKVMWTHTIDGINWKKPEMLIPDPDGELGNHFAVASGFYSYDKRLIVYYSSTVHDKSESDLYAISSQNGHEWSTPYKIISNVHVIENPRQLSCGRILIGGMFANRKPRILYTDSADGLNGWTDALIPSFPDKIQRAFPEPSWFVRPDGIIVMLLRATRSEPWLYASISKDRGETWSVPERTGIPSATSRMSVGNLPDGRIYCIWNPSQHTDLPHRGRNPLVIALSTDMITFNTAYVLRNESSSLSSEGISKLPGWQYPAAVIWRDSLWVAYSANKEDIHISQISLCDLN